jgi:hypothetical protein
MFYKPFTFCYNYVRKVQSWLADRAAVVMGPVFRGFIHRYLL